MAITYSHIKETMQSKSLRTSMSTILIIALVIGMISVSPFMKNDATYAATSNYTLSNVTKPGTLLKGQPFVIKGTINSALAMKRVEVGVVQGGKWVSGCYANKYINSKTFNVFTADSSIGFGKLQPGTYYYRIWAWDANGSRKVLDHVFTVSSAAAKSKITLSGITKPGNITKGKSFTLKGTINSVLAIKRVEVGIASSDGKKWIANHKIDKYPNLLSFNVANVDSQIKFNNLAAGNYRYKIWVHDANGAHLMLNHAFKVVNPVTITPKPTPIITTSKKLLSYNNQLITKIGKQSASKCSVYAAGYCRAIIDKKGPIKSGYSSPRSVVENYYWLNGIGASWGRAGGTYKYYSGNKTYTVQYCLNKAVAEIDKGKPSVILVDNSATKNTHYLAVVGYQNVTNKSAVSLKNLIVIDPVTATQRNMSSISNYKELSRTKNRSVYRTDYSSAICLF